MYRKYQNAIILAVLLVLSLSILLTNLRGKTSLNFMERAAISIMAPFQNAVSWSATNIFDTWDRYAYLVNVKEENLRLKRIADKLAFENTMLTERFKFYERLNALLSFPRLESTAYRAGRIIGRDTTGKVRLVTLNRGSNDGLAVNMPVVTNRGLAGRIVRVAGSVSKALLITDVRSAVDAIAQETRNGLVAVGTNSAYLDVHYLAVDAKVKDGDRVISSGLGGVYPKGLLIGVLTDIKKTGDSLFLSARLVPSVDLDRMEEALVLKGEVSGLLSGKDWP